MIRHAFPLMAAFGLPGALAAQSFQDNTTDIPTGGAANNSSTENVAFADVDRRRGLGRGLRRRGRLRQRPRSPLDQPGRAQSGAVGVFVDETTAQLPACRTPAATSTSPTSTWTATSTSSSRTPRAVSNQGSRFFVNQGGAQGASGGFFAEVTPTAYVEPRPVNDGTTAFSSIARPSCCRPATSSTGPATRSSPTSTTTAIRPGAHDLRIGGARARSPSRLFLNDGAGHFEEFNPSGFQLTGSDIADGDPALWARAARSTTTTPPGSRPTWPLAACRSHVGDLDGDFDVDILHGEKFELPRDHDQPPARRAGRSPSATEPRRLRRPELGPGQGQLRAGPRRPGRGRRPRHLRHGLGFVGSAAARPRLRASARPSPRPIQRPTLQRQSEPDFLDYDGDGDLDVFIASEYQHERVYENAGAAGSGCAARPARRDPDGVNTRRLGADVADVDQDGDYDVFVANDLGEANPTSRTPRNVADATAPRVAAARAGPRPRREIRADGRARARPRQRQLVRDAVRGGRPQHCGRRRRVHGAPMTFAAARSSAARSRA